MIKLLALDIDNTLTDINGEISHDAIEILQKIAGKGVIIAFISARPPQGIEYVIKKIGIEAYKIAYLGSVIQNPSGVELQRLTIELETAKAIACYADKYNFPIIMNINDVEYQSQMVPRPSMTPRFILNEARGILKNSDAPTIIGVSGEISTTRIYQYCVRYQKKRVYIARHLNPDGTNASALIVNPFAQKGFGLNKLCEWLSIPLSCVMAIGDSESDISMISIAGLGIAVQNADDQVKKAAKIITPLPYGSGVTWAVENFLD